MIAKQITEARKGIGQGHEAYLFQIELFYRKFLRLIIHANIYAHDCSLQVCV